MSRGLWSALGLGEFLVPCGSGGACVVAPGVRMLGVGLGDQYLVGDVLRIRVGGARQSCRTFNLDACCVGSRKPGIFDRYEDQDGASKSEGLQANAKD